MSTRSQRLRIKKEKRDLAVMFGKWASFREGSGLTQVELQLKTTKNNDYTLRCYLDVDFPNSMPDLVVCHPEEPLKDRDGKPLEISFENHCLGYERYSLTQICHCRPDRWDPRYMSLTEVFNKGLLWIEAYEIIKKTGEHMSKFLPEMPMSQEMEEKLAKLNMRIERNFVNQMMLELECDSPEEVFERLVQGMVAMMAGYLDASNVIEDETFDEEMDD